MSETASAPAPQTGTTETQKTATRILTGKNSIQDFFRDIGFVGGKKVSIDLTEGKPETITLSANPGFNKVIKAQQYSNQPVTGEIVRVEASTAKSSNTFMLTVKTRGNNERVYTVTVQEDQIKN